MKLKSRRANSRESTVILEFDSKDIGSGAVDAIYQGVYKAMSIGPQVNRPHNTLSYQSDNPKWIKKAKRRFERMIQAYGGS